MSTSSRVRRIIFGALFAGSVMLAPFWLSAAIAVLGVLSFKWYFEVFAAGIFFDAFYGVPDVPLLLRMSVAAAALLLVCEILFKPRARWYNR